MGYATHIIGFAGILQTAIFIMIVVELIGLIRSLFSGSGSRKAIKDDLDRYEADKSTKKYEDDIEKKASEEEKDKKKSAESEKELEEAAKGEADAVVTTDGDVRELVDEEKALVEKLNSPGVEPEDIKPNIERMLVKVSQLKKDFKIMYKVTRRLEYIDGEFRRSIDKLLEKEEGIKKTFSDELAYLESKLSKTKDGSDSKKKYAEKYEKAAIKCKDQESKLNELRSLTSVLIQNIKKNKEDLNKLERVDLRTVSHVNKLYSEVKKINNDLSGFEVDPKKREEKKKELINDALRLHNNLRFFVESWTQLKNANDSVLMRINEEIIHPYTKFMSVLNRPNYTVNY